MHEAVIIPVGDRKPELHERSWTAPGAVVADPNYTIRAWRGVVTYLLRRYEFLYE